MSNPPELVFTLWKVLALLWNERIDRANLIKLVKKQSGDQFLNRLLDFDIKDVHLS